MPRFLGLVLLAMSQCCCFSGLAKFAQRQPSTMVLLRHGEREDYIAQKAGRGAQWVKESLRPWDPALAPNGQQQAQSAAKRLRQVLETAQLPLPSKIFTSPMLRAVETANFVADEFAVKSLYVEEGLTESVYEHWMRQWAVPGANSDWGGPPHSCMPQGRNTGDPRLVRGTPVAEEDLRPEALEGASKLIPTSGELKLKCGFSRVDESYVSCVPVRDRGYRWGHFETHSEVVERCTEAVRKCMARYPQETLVFVSHGGPTQYCLKEFSGRKYEGSAGMTAMSVLRAAEASWEVVVANDAAHAKAYAVGEETKI